MEDYAGTEKIGYLPRKLSIHDAPKGSDPSVGDFTYYSPWGNLAIFYQDFGYSNGLIILGQIESGIEKLASIRNNSTVKVDRVGEESNSSKDSVFVKKIENTRKVKRQKRNIICEI